VIVVSGTQRSGTSLWMQVLHAAGFPVIGEPFPAGTERLAAANPRGFWESQLAGGIYFRTNPHPYSGDYLAPGPTRDHAVKVFLAGLVRSDVAFLDRVLVTVRGWRELAASAARLDALRTDLRASPAAAGGAEPGGLPEAATSAAARLEDAFHERLPPALAWWSDHFAFIRDVAVRGYPVHVVSYERLLAAPEREIDAALGWIGAGELAPAIAAVEPQLRTQRAAPTPDGVAPEDAAIFDELYRHLHEGIDLSDAFIAELNAADARLRPQILAHAAHARRAFALRALGLADEPPRGGPSPSAPASAASVHAHPRDVG